MQELAGFLLRVLRLTVLCALSALFVPAQSLGQTPDSLGFYQQLKRFELSGAAVKVESLTLKRDRVEITFDGTFYFETPIDGRVYGAVFVGSGTFHADAPPSKFEQDNLRRMLKSGAVGSDFKTAVLRFSDDTFDFIGKGAATQVVPSQAQKLALEFEPRMLKETGANISARLAISVLNQEPRGFFVGQFDGGHLDRFSFVMDYQTRIPATQFEVNGGEKGLIFSYRGFNNDIWLAFYSMEDYARGQVEYSDAHDLVHVRHYQMQADVRQPTKALRLEVRMETQLMAPGVRVIPFTLNDNLGEYDNERLKKSLRLKSAAYGDGSPAAVVQENWESGLTVFLPAAKPAFEKLEIVLELEGDALYDSPYIPECYYPLSSEGWYPRHGYLNRSTFDITFRHRKEHRVASVGVLVREEPAADSKSDMLTEWKMESPVALVGFGVGRLERHSETRKLKDGTELPVEFYSLPGSTLAIKEDFILAELGNTVDYFGAIFGRYPYPRFRAVYHPRGYGQGLASMLLLPRSDRASKYTYSFIAHETSHQWWGNIVAWRSYRDQWLSEGFAEYSGILYTGLRDTKSGQRELIRETRDILAYPPRTEVGVGKGRLADVGPLILGHRLSTRETYGAYTALIYNKGALVLRMLHFLFTDPNTGEGQAFFDMMADFVKRYHDGAASTENFIAVANEHFARTALAKQFRVKDLNWFFREYVYSSELPSYTLGYSLQNGPEGGAVLRINLLQSGVPDDWFMALPVVVKFGKDRYAHIVVGVLGKGNQMDIQLPSRPSEVQLDPDYWVLSEKTVTIK